jgi:plasmid stabilization system protein ParE
MKIRWSESAFSELDNIFSYIQRNNRSAAIAVVERIEAMTALLEEFPLVGHLTDEAGVRFLAVVRYPFLIFYAIDDAAARSSSCMCCTPRNNGLSRLLKRGLSAYSAAAMRGRPTYPVASPKRSTITAGRSLALLVTQAPERTA